MFASKCVENTVEVSLRAVCLKAMRRMKKEETAKSQSSKFIYDGDGVQNTPISYM